MNQIEVKDIIYQAKELLSHLEEMDDEGRIYYLDESAKRLHNLILGYEQRRDK